MTLEFIGVNGLGPEWFNRQCSPTRRFPRGKVSVSFVFPGSLDSPVECTKVASSIQDFLDGPSFAPGTLVALMDVRVPRTPLSDEAKELLSLVNLVFTSEKLSARRLVSAGFPSGKICVSGDTIRAFAAMKTGSSRRPPVAFLNLSSEALVNDIGARVGNSLKGKVSISDTVGELKKGCKVCVCDRGEVARCSLDAGIPVVFVGTDQDLLEEFGDKDCVTFIDYPRDKAGRDEVHSVCVFVATSEICKTAAIRVSETSSKPWDTFKLVEAWAKSRTPDQETPLSRPVTSLWTREFPPGPSACVAGSSRGPEESDVEWYLRTGSITGTKTKDPPFCLPELLTQVELQGSLGSEFAGKRVRMVHNDSVDMGDAHRSGWPFALSGLGAATQLGHVIGEEEILLDCYTERTFLWGEKTLRETGVLPYAKPWIGFVHHTLDSGYSKNGLIELTREGGAFQESLGTCLGLVTLSGDLAVKLRERLEILGFGDVRVSNIVHPTDLDVKKFSSNDFARSPKVVSVGSWLRDPMGIHDISTRQSDQLKPVKMVLTSPGVKDIDARLESTLEWLEASARRAAGLVSAIGPCVPPLPDSTIPDPEVLGSIVSRIRRSSTDVKVIETLGDPEYDKLLASCAVFLKLRDASAVNAVIECIARGTPMIVNRLPAIEEYLGAGYPGFYDSDSEASEMIASIQKFIRIITYIQTNIDRKKLDIRKFMVAVANVVKDRTDSSQE